MIWLWLAIDPLTKILPVVYLGPRTQHAAHMVIHSLRQLLAAFLSPALHKCLIYGQVKKSYQRRKLTRVTHVMRLGTQADLKIALQGMGFSGRLNTALAAGRTNRRWTARDVLCYPLPPVPG